MKANRIRQRYLSVIAVNEDGNATWYGNLGQACMEHQIGRETLIRYLLTGEEVDGIQWQWACDCDEELRLCCTIAYFSRKLYKSDHDRRSKDVASEAVQELQKTYIQQPRLL